MPSPTTSSATNQNVPASLDPHVDALLAGVKWDAGPAGTGAALTYSFPWINDAPATFAGYNGAPYSELGENTAAARYGLNLEQQAAAREALAQWSAVANLTFQQVADTAANVGDLRFAWTSASSDAGVWGWATYPSAWWPAAGDVWISTRGSGSDPSQGWTPGSGNFSSLLHEIGHAIGLKHPFEGSNRLPVALDSTQFSVMSYTEGPNSLFLRVTQEGSSVRWASFNVQPDTPMLLDIATAQYLYGANMSYRTGNDVYTFDPSVPFMRTIWDAGGSDTISIANFTRGSTIDLRAGSFSSISIPSDSAAGYNWSSPPPAPTYDGTNNLAIAYGAVIENAIGGSGDDHLIGNAANNHLRGGAGNDRIHGGAGIDTAVYVGLRSSWSAVGSELVVERPSEGRDVLTGVERLEFTNESVALDLAGNAGTVAKILGAVFGRAAVSNAAYAGIGLSLLDGGASYETLMQFALDVSVGSGASNRAVVDLLYRNVMGALPEEQVARHYTALLDAGTFTNASLGVMAAETSYNQEAINLTGLAQTGLIYV